MVISKPDSNFKHGSTMNFNGKEMKWMMMLELLSLGLSFLQVCLEIHIVAMYVECRSLKAWHNTWSQILWRVGHFQWWQACPHFLWMTTSIWCHHKWKYTFKVHHRAPHCLLLMALLWPIWSLFMSIHLPWFLIHIQLCYEIFFIVDALLWPILVFLHVHLGFSLPSNWEDFLHKRWKSFLFKEREGDHSFPLIWPWVKRHAH